MISKLTLKNFRGFEEHELDFRSTTVLVGANNAGKSTIVEALRLVALVAGKYKNLQYNDTPKHLEHILGETVVRPSIAGMGFQNGHLFHRYEDPPAVISAAFTNGSRITVVLDTDAECFASISTAAGETVQNQAAAKRANVPQVEIMPQIGPVRLEEEVLTERYVRQASASSLGSLHFRNQLKIFSESFPKFCTAVSETWPGVKIVELIRPHSTDKQQLHLEVRNDDFVGEIGTMGHGLQMWMQAIWFLCRASESATVILDEPDVYMHADLQRRLIRYVRGKYPQVIIATHSIEIMSEVASEDILVVDRRRKVSHFAVSTPAVQSLISKIGSAHNLQLARLWNAKRLILVEGKDMNFLKVVHNKLFPKSAQPIDAIPNMSLGGWGGWDYAIGSDMLMRNALGQEIETYCVFDRDYHTEASIKKRRKQAVDRGVSLTIWRQKEIENYFLIPNVISRLIQSRSALGVWPSADAIKDKIAEAADAHQDAAFDALVTEWLAENRSEGVARANQQARRIISDEREKRGQLARLVSGKQLISDLSRWSQDAFRVSVNLQMILHEMYADEVPGDVAKLVTAIERGVSFSL